MSIKLLTFDINTLDFTTKFHKLAIYLHTLVKKFLGISALTIYRTCNLKHFKYLLGTNKSNLGLFKSLVKFIPFSLKISHL